VASKSIGVAELSVRTFETLAAENIVLVFHAVYFLQQNIVFRRR
jgi:hypothetical protein